VAEGTTLAELLTTAMWAPAYAFIAWAAWYRFRRTPAGLVLAIAYALQAGHVMLATADDLGALGGLTRSASAHLVPYALFWSAGLLLMVFQVVGLALIPLSLQRLSSRIEPEQREG
jgi:hypothetical protein